MAEQQKIKAIEDCISEAQRFIKKASEARTRLKQESEKQWSAAGTKEYASAKRAALDLKRELTKITNTIY